MAKAPNPFAGDADYLGPISATPQKMVETMLELAGVGPGDVVYDLGCNDGRVCITAARDRGARGVGVEIDQGAVDKARRLVRDAPARAPRSRLTTSISPLSIAPASPSSSLPADFISTPSIPRRRSSQADEAGVASLVDIRLGNAVAEPLTDATVTFVYLLPKGNAKVSRKLMRELKPGTLVMTYVFRLPADHWDAHLERVEAIKSTRDRASGGVDASAYNKIYAYRVPEFKPAWCEENPEDGDDRGDRDAGGVRV